MFTKRRSKLHADWLTDVVALNLKRLFLTADVRYSERHSFDIDRVFRVRKI